MMKNQPKITKAKGYVPENEDCSVLPITEPKINKVLRRKVEGKIPMGGDQTYRDEE